MNQKEANVTRAEKVRWAWAAERGQHYPEAARFQTSQVTALFLVPRVLRFESRSDMHLKITIPIKNNY